MFKKIFEYAGPYKKNMYVATVVVLVSVLMGILPFVLAYQVISPLVMGDSVETEFVLLRVIGVLICLVLQAFFMDGDYQFLIKQHITHCSGCGYLCKRSLRNFPLALWRKKGQGQSKSCLSMMWTAWNCSLLIQSRRVSQIC